MTVRRCVVILSFVFFLPLMAGAQWSQTAGPTGGYVDDLAASGTTLLAATEGGLFLSTNNGGLWTPGPPLSSELRVLAGTGGSRVWGGSSGGVFLSTDDGAHWAAVGGGMGARAVGALAANPSVALAATSDGIFRSTDLGAHWDSLGGPLPGYMANVLFMDGTTLWAGFQASPHCLFRSTNGGAAWQPADSGITPGDLRSILRAGGKLFSSTWGGGVFVSGDSGVSWQSSGTGIVGSIVDRIFAAGPMLVAGSDYGVFVSADTGKSWTATAEFPMTGYGAHSFASIGGVLFAGGVDGVYSSTNAGTTWTSRRDGMTGTLVKGIAVLGSTLAAGSAYTGVSLSTDGGGHWAQSGSGFPPHITYTIEGTGNLLFEGGNLGAYRSTDLGAHWTAANNGFGSYNPTHAFAVLGTTVYAGGNLGLFRSTDSAASWSSLSAGLGVKSFRSVFVVSALGPTILAGTSDTLFRSSDGGAHWTAVRRSLVIAMARLGNELYAAEGTGALMSTDEGMTWNAANLNLNPTSGYALCPVGNDLFFGSEAGVFRTEGKGSGWTSVSSGLPGGPVYSLRAGGGYLYAGAGFAGLWKRPLTEIATDVVAEPALPGKISLGQNYPNPFNPSTTIRYGLPRMMRVKLTVYNTLGQEVAVLQDGEQEAGYHDVRFTGSHLASGVYFYRLQAGDVASTMKLTLVK